MNKEGVSVILMGALSIVLLLLLLFARGFIAEYIELQILTAFQIVLVVIHIYHIGFLMYSNEVRSLHDLTKPPNAVKATLYFSIITMLDILVATYSMDRLLSQKNKTSNKSIFALPYGVIVIVNLMMGILATGLLLFLFTHFIFLCAKKCRPNIEYRKVRVLSVFAMMLVDVIVLARFFTQRQSVLNNFKVLGGQVAKNGFLNFFVMFWSVILYLRKPGYELFLSFCFFICLAIYSSDFYFLLRNFFYELESNLEVMFSDEFVVMTEYFFAFIFTATISIIEVTIFTLKEFMNLIKHTSLLNHLPQQESKRLYKIKARYIESMILTWPQVIGYINLYLTTPRLYSFIMMLVALLTTQIVKHFMIRRNMGARIQFNFPNNEYNSKSSAIGILISTVTQALFIVIGVIIIQLNYTNVSTLFTQDDIRFKINYTMSVVILTLAVLFQFLGYRRTHLHILLLVGMDRAPVPAAAIHPNSGLTEEQFQELVEIAVANPDNDVCNICLDSMVVSNPDEGGNIVVSIKACRHEFHKACLQQWSNRKSTCPKCRVSMLNPPQPVRMERVEEEEVNQSEGASNLAMIPANS